MRTVGAAQFIVNSGNPASESAFVSVGQTLRQALIDMLPTEGPPLVLPRNGEFKFGAGHELELSTAGNENGPALWTCNWSHPDNQNENIVRKERIQLAQTGPGPAQFELLELASASGASEERLSVPPDGIAIVAPIMQGFQCSVNGRPISSIPRLIGDETVEDFVEQDLSSPRRRLPLILVSKSEKEELPSVDPARLAKIVAGLAEVFLIQDNSVAMGLADLLTRRLACTNGSVRIYNTGFTRGANPLHHPITLGDTIKSWRKTLFQPELYFLDRVGRISAIAHSEGSTIQEARRLLREEFGKNLLQQRTTRASLMEQVESLKSELDEKNRYVADLEDELERQRRLWYEYRPGALAADAPPVVSGETALPEFDSVHSALQFAAAQWPDRLTVLQSGWDSALETDSRRRTEVFTAVGAIKEVGDQMFAGGHFGQNIETLYRQRFNLRYRARDHQATVDEYGDFRRFLYDGRRVLFENHITIGPNSNSCLQIYFLLDSRTRKVVIGYCGKHLPTKGWQS
jgi:hypothetical protein